MQEKSLVSAKAGILDGEHGLMGAAWNCIRTNVGCLAQISHKETIALSFDMSRHLSEWGFTLG
jgi:hypothetical protein